MSKSDNNKNSSTAVQQLHHVGSKKLTEKEIKEQIENALHVPVAIMKRVNALKNLQVQLLDVESKFYEELHLLECKFQTQYDELYEKRKVVVSGEVEPTEEESKWALDDADSFNLQDADDAEKTPLKAIENTSEPAKDEPSTDLAKDLKAKLSLNDAAKNTKGVPEFWLQTLKSAELIQDMIQEHDEPILKHLNDLRVRLHDTKPYGYTLEFVFNENDYFTNTVLTKTYDLKMDLDPKDPFSYEGPDIYKCKGCTIDWKKGKNVTVRSVKKKQKHKQSGSIRVVTKEIKQDSFFNYFDTPKQLDNNDSGAIVKADDTVSGGEEVDEESLLAADFEIGHFIKERIIPKAILYFTGEINDDYDDEEYEDDDDEDDDDEDDEDEDDDDEDDDDDDDEDDDDAKHDVGNKHGGHGAHGHSNNKNNNNNKNNKQSGGGAQNHHQKSPSSRQHQNSGGDPKNQPPECKQN